MIIRLKKNQAEKIGLKEFERFGENKSQWEWREEVNLDLDQFSRKKVEQLEAMLSAHPTVRGVTQMLNDIKTWYKAVDDPTITKPRTVQHFHSMLKRFMLKVPGQRIYKKVEDRYFAYYVNQIEFHEKTTDRDGRVIPAYETVHLMYEDIDGSQRERIKFDLEDCFSMSIPEAFIKQEFVFETEELRQTYLDSVARFHDIVKRVGTVYTAVGTGTDDLDGNPNYESNSYWSRHNRNTIYLEKSGQPSRVVIDVFHETDKKKSDKNTDRPDAWFWNRVKNKLGDHEDDEHMELPEDSDEVVPPEVPIHPFVAVFHLAKHLRLRVHVDFLTRYRFNMRLSENLVLEKESKDLIEILIKHDSEFTDIVRGKSGGTTTLLSGPPGVGKTLTAEVFAESSGKALYSVQCSQLGLSPKELEESLLVVFDRANRWGAVLLLDEADVYLRQRGSDLIQNAMVGVFLRLFEYQSTVLFLTTHRPDDIDDAIVSRCIANIRYKTPSPENLKRIWEILAAVSKVNISKETIQKAAEHFSGISGRDVKNLIKLGSLLKHGEEVLLEDLKHVKQFKPDSSC